MSEESTQPSAENAPETGFTLSSYEPVSITLPVVNVTDEQVEEQIAQIAESLASYEKVEDREIREDDHLYIELQSFEDGKPFTPLTGRRILKLGDGFMPEGFEAQVKTMQVGETKTFDFELEGPPAGDGESAPALNKTITATVTVLEIREHTAGQLTDAWVAKNIMGCDTVDGFRARIRQDLQQQWRQHIEQRKYYECVAELAKRLDARIPDPLFEQGLRDTHKSFEHNLAQQGMTLDEFLQQEGISRQQFDMEMLMQARQMVAQAIALDLLAEHLNLNVSDEEINMVFGGKNAQQNAAARKACEDAGKLPEARQAALRNKAVQWLGDTAHITYEA